MLLFYTEMFCHHISEINCNASHYSPAKCVAFVHNLQDFLAKQVDYFCNRFVAVWSVSCECNEAWYTPDRVETNVFWLCAMRVGSSAPHAVLYSLCHCHWRQSVDNIGRGSKRRTKAVGVENETPQGSNGIGNGEGVLLFITTATQLSRANTEIQL